jgi:hypothetical protein
LIEATTGPENFGREEYWVFHLAVIKDRVGWPNPTKETAVAANAERTSRAEHAKRSVFWGLIALICTGFSRKRNGVAEIHLE